MLPGSSPINNEIPILGKKLSQIEAVEILRKQKADRKNEFMRVAATEMAELERYFKK